MDEHLCQNCLKKGHGQKDCTAKPRKKTIILSKFFDTPIEENNMLAEMTQRLEQLALCGPDSQLPVRVRNSMIVASTSHTAHSSALPVAMPQGKRATTVAADGSRDSKGLGWFAKKAVAPSSKISTPSKSKNDDRRESSAWDRAAPPPLPGSTKKVRPPRRASSPSRSNSLSSTQSTPTHSSHPSTSSIGDVEPPSIPTSVPPVRKGKRATSSMTIPNRHSRPPSRTVSYLPTIPADSGISPLLLGKAGKGGEIPRFNFPQNGHKRVRRRKFFGCPLINVCPKDNDGFSVPDALLQLAALLLKHGLEVEGIFRIPGGGAAMAKYRSVLDKGDVIEFCGDIHAVAGTFKLFWRLLPEPLLTFVNYEDLVSAAEAKDAEKVVNIVQSLPAINIKVLHFLLDFLSKVSERSEVNKMTEGNLGVVFAPNLLRPRVETPATIMGHTRPCIAVITMLIAWSR